MRNKRTCLNCANDRISGQRWCAECHAAYMRDWRKDNPISDEQRRRNIARVTVNVYVKRGKLQKTACPCCGALDVKARILDYSDPLHSVEWLCATSHAYAVRTGHLPAIRRAA